MPIPTYMNAFAVTPSDSTTFTGIPNATTGAAITRQIYVGSNGGNLSVLTAGNQSVTFNTVPNGTLLPIAVIKVLAATTSTGVVGLY